MEDYTTWKLEALGIRLIQIIYEIVRLGETDYYLDTANYKAATKQRDAILAELCRRDKVKGS